MLLVVPLALPRDLAHPAPTAQCGCAGVDPALPGIGTARSCGVSGWVRRCTSTQQAHAHSGELPSCPAFCRGSLWCPSQGHHRGEGGQWSRGDGDLSCHRFPVVAWGTRW